MLSPRALQRLRQLYVKCQADDDDDDDDDDVVLVFM